MGFDVVDDGGEVGSVEVFERGRVAEVGFLSGGRGRSGSEEQPGFVDEVDVGAGLFEGEFEGEEGIDVLVCDSSAGGSGAEDEDAGGFEGECGDLAGGVDGSHGDCTGALDVVVEAGELGGVGFEEAAGVGEAKVFKVENREGEDGFDGLDDVVDECVVFLASDSWLTDSEIEVVLEEVFILKFVMSVKPWKARKNKHQSHNPTQSAMSYPATAPHKASSAPTWPH